MSWDLSDANEKVGKFTQERAVAANEITKLGGTRFRVDALGWWRCSYLLKGKHTVAPLQARSGQELVELLRKVREEEWRG